MGMIKDLQLKMYAVFKEGTWTICAPLCEMRLKVLFLLSLQRMAIPPPPKREKMSFLHIFFTNSPLT
jgi:hypothetical protein